VPVSHLLHRFHHELLAVNPLLANLASAKRADSLRRSRSKLPVPEQGTATDLLDVKRSVAILRSSCQQPKSWLEVQLQEIKKLVS
jgi:hypothetical protein